MDLEPLLERLLYHGEGVQLLLYFGAEGSDAASSKHLNEVHHVILKLLLVVSNATTNDAREIIRLVIVNDELGAIPIGVNFLTERLLNLLLLEGGVADILTIFLDGEKVSVEKLLQGEGLGLVRDLLASKLDELLPMAVLNGLVTEHLNERQDDLHIVKALLELLVGGVLLGVSGKLEAVFEELLNTLLHTIDLAGNIKPNDLLPLSDSLSDLKVESVKLIKLVELVLGLH